MPPAESRGHMNLSVIDQSKEQSPHAPATVTNDLASS
jgi:hypothetical protein